MNLIGNRFGEILGPLAGGTGLFDPIKAPVLNLSPDGTIRAVNRAFLAESGYLPGEVVGQSVLCLVHSGSVNQVTEAFSRCLSGDESFCTLEAVMKDGRRAAYRAAGTPVWGGDGMVRSVFVMSWSALGEEGCQDARQAAPGCRFSGWGDRRQSVNLNECIRATAGVSGGDEIILSLSPRVPHTMADMVAAERMSMMLLEPPSNCQPLLRLATRRHKGTIVISAVYGSTGSVPASLSWISEMRKAAAGLSGGFHVQAAPDGGSEVTITVPILLPEKNEAS